MSRALVRVDSSRPHVRCCYSGSDAVLHTWQLQGWGLEAGSRGPCPAGVNPVGAGQGAARVRARMVGGLLQPARPFLLVGRAGPARVPGREGASSSMFLLGVPSVSPLHHGPALLPRLRGRLGMPASHSSMPLCPRDQPGSRCGVRAGTLTRHPERGQALSPEGGCVRTS